MILKSKLKILLLLFVFIANVGFAQQDVQLEVSLESPYETIFTHLYFLQEDSYEPVKSAYTIQGNYSDIEKQEFAIKIKKVLDGKGLYIDMGILPHNLQFLPLNLNFYYYIFLN